MILNKKHHIISNLDIFARVGMAAAYDEVTYLSVEDGQLIVDGESSDFRGTLTIEFAKVRNLPHQRVSHVCITTLLVLFFLSQGSYDNPKVNAIVLLKGPLQDTGT